MEILTGIKLSKEEVMSLLTYFDDSSDIPLHEGLNFDAYSEKLSKNAYFVLAMENRLHLGFIAYYLNCEGNFAYIPQTVVHKSARHKGLGHIMFESLYKELQEHLFGSLQLEVLKNNNYARDFYHREGFVEKKHSNDRIGLVKIFDETGIS